jgi:hypothetical protein
LVPRKHAYGFDEAVEQLKAWNALGTKVRF